MLHVPGPTDMIMWPRCWGKEHVRAMRAFQNGLKLAPGDRILICEVLYPPHALRVEGANIRLLTGTGTDPLDGN